MVVLPAPSSPSINIRHCRLASPNDQTNCHSEEKSAPMMDKCIILMDGRTMCVVIRLTMLKLLFCVELGQRLPMSRGCCFQTDVPCFVGRTVRYQAGTTCSTYIFDDRKKKFVPVCLQPSFCHPYGFIVARRCKVCTRVSERRRILIGI
jgi:hypothetical protein